MPCSKNPQLELKSILVALEEWDLPISYRGEVFGGELKWNDRDWMA